MQTQTVTSASRSMVRTVVLLGALARVLLLFSLASLPLPTGSFQPSIDGFGENLYVSKKHRLVQDGRKTLAWLALPPTSLGTAYDTPTGLPWSCAAGRRFLHQKTCAEMKLRKDLLSVRRASIWTSSMSVIRGGGDEGVSDWEGTESFPQKKELTFGDLPRTGGSERLFAEWEGMGGEIRILIGGMKCAGCAGRVEKLLAGVDGVTQVSGILESRRLYLAILTVFRIGLPGNLVLRAVFSWNLSPTPLPA